MKSKYWFVVLFVAFFGSAFCALSADLTAEEFQELQNVARTEEKEGAYKDAAKNYSALVEASSRTEEKATFLLHEAECYLFAGNVSDARQGFTTLLNDYPYFVPYDRVIERLRQLAECYEQGKGTFFGFKDVDGAISIYRLILAENPSVQASLKDRLKFAELLLETKNNIEAASVYFKILREIPSQNDVRYLYVKLMLKISRTGDGDGSKMRVVRREIQRFLDTVPKDDKRREEMEQLLTESKEIVAGRKLIQAKFYLQKYHRHPEVARRYLHDTIRDFPDTQAAAEAAALLKQESLTEIFSNGKNSESKGEK
ncbi:MAG: tetratricopeptide repeat protein [Lentisphaeria bacterium]